MTALPKTDYTPTKNACKLCSPLGASFVFKGIEGAVPLLHGSQGCSTYIRRYMISHFKEPVDIASSNFTEDTAIFGGGANLKLALENISRQYEPKLIGIATTCLSETIGEDVPQILRSLRYENNDAESTILVPVSTPSYKGTHMDGFHSAVRAVVDRLATYNGPTDTECVNLFPGMVSCQDIRHLKEIFKDFKLSAGILPDYSDRLDGALWSEYQRIQPGGTPIDLIKQMGASRASIEFGQTIEDKNSAANLLSDRFSVPRHTLGLPIGVKATDCFFQLLEELSESRTPMKYAGERSRLLDAYVDGHKYVSGVKALVYGEEDMVVSLAGFLREIGAIPILCATGARSGKLEKAISQLIPDKDLLGIQVKDGIDFLEMESVAASLAPDFLIGNSKGYTLSRKLEAPLVRVGFPIHDRLGGARILHLGYRGTQSLYDTIVNAIIASRQASSPVGYTYM